MRLRTSPPSLSTAARTTRENESVLIRCAAHSARISEVGTPQTFSV
jgi:hypothetical protein